MADTLAAEDDAARNGHSPKSSPILSDASWAQKAPDSEANGPRHARARSNSAPIRGQLLRSTPLRERNVNAGARRPSRSEQADTAPKLSQSRIHALLSDPSSLPLRSIDTEAAEKEKHVNSPSDLDTIAELHALALDSMHRSSSPGDSGQQHPVLDPATGSELRLLDGPNLSNQHAYTNGRALSTPASAQKIQSLLEPQTDSWPSAPAGLNGSAGSVGNTDEKKSVEKQRRQRQADALGNAGDMTPSLPLPPLSLPTYLDLELSSERPSQLYIRSESASDAFYESTRVKMERLRNFLILPPQLENVLLFGALTCLDAWLYTFTILPIRFAKASWVYLDWLSHNSANELRDLASYVYQGLGRLWHRHRQTEGLAEGKTGGRGSSVQPASLQRSAESSRRPSIAARRPTANGRKETVDFRQATTSHRTSSKPSMLSAEHKADLLQGLLICLNCMVLMRFDASRMYHAIRGQSAIKLYVIFNVLEVFDRLFSALGQDILECLFSSEMLERTPSGRSQVFQPFWMFMLALIYSICHATALFYQVVTLNVAVNSYSNALLTLLMSNQFVEIKGTVFKKFEKENLFQITCADVVERFQLWIMLLIIALRNIVEVGGLSIVMETSSAGSSGGGSGGDASAANGSTASAFSTLNILPVSFTLLPSMPVLQVLSPFLIVLASEMVVDWLKHAYITKFNATSPRIYGRFFDILAKDYYSNAFRPPFASVTRRLGLPIIPLACLFIRAAVQTYHMFLATNISSSSSSFTTSDSTSLATQDDLVSSGFMAEGSRMFQRALGHSSLGGGLGRGMRWSLDDAIALITMLVFFLAVYLILLAFKLVLGMALLQTARARYASMHRRERERLTLPDTRRVGGWGAAAVGDERRRIIYEGDGEGLTRAREREAAIGEASKAKGGGGGSSSSLERVQRYSMVAKRIW